MPRIPVRRVMASPTVAPAFTFSRIRGGYANPGPCPTVIRPERSTTAQYWTSKWSERTDDHTRPASMPTPKSPPPIADFARFIAPWTASSSNGWSETSVFTRTPRTRAGRESAWKTSFTARIFTGLFEPMNTCSGLRRLPRRSISPSRMRREADDDGLRPAVEGGTEQGLMPRVQEVERPAEDDAHLADHPVDTI